MVYSPDHKTQTMFYLNKSSFKVLNKTIKIYGFKTINFSQKTLFYIDSFLLKIF